MVEMVILVNNAVEVVIMVEMVIMVHMVIMVNLVILKLYCHLLISNAVEALPGADHLQIDNH